MKRFALNVVLVCTVGAACRRSAVNATTAALSFNCPSQPNALAIRGQNVSLDFGNIPLGETASIEVDLTSLSNSGTTITAVSQVQGNPTLTFPLAPGVTVQPSPPTMVFATFVPTQAGPQTASLKIDLGISPAIQLTLLGNGFPVSLTVSPDPVDFGDVEIHSSVPRTITVTNSSPQAITLTLTLPDGGPFSIGPLTKNALGAGESLSLTATYAPAQAEVDSSSFSLTGCAGCKNGVVVPMKGVGVASSLAYPNPLPFGFVTPKTSVQKTLALKNIGQSVLQILGQPTLYPGVAIPPSDSPPVFAFASGQPNVSYPYSLAAGNELDFPIAFTPPSLGAYLDATVSFRSSDPSASQVVVSLQGYGGGAQISCQPPSLDFGPVAVGFTVTQPLVCINVGTDVPGHPEAALQLNQSQLSTDNPLFAATLLGNRDGGASVSLSAGQSTTLRVSFNPRSNPRDGGVQTATLEVGSNDLAHDPLAIPLVGRGITAGPCAAAALPPDGLNFGEVPVGSSAALQLGIENQSNDYCVLGDLHLADGGDPAFSLPDGEISYQLLSFVGDPDNTTNLPTELRVAVQFAPTHSETASGSVDFQLVNGNPVDWSVPLSGSSAPACLTLVPSRLDFGLVELDETSHSLCFNPHQTMSLENNCPQPVTLQAITLAPGLDNPPQFSLAGVPATPLTLAAGGQAHFSVTFTATEAGAKVETLAVTTTASSLPYAFTLTGDAESVGKRTDTFVVPQKQVDLLLLIDVDDECSNNNDTLSDQIPSLIQQLNDGHIDYRIAAMDDGIYAMDAGPAKNGNTPFWDQGSFLPCDHCLVRGSNAIYVTPQSSPTPAAALGQLVYAVFNSNNDDCEEAAGGGLQQDEQLFESLAQAFASPLLAGHNAGFLRDAAYLAILGINGDGEDDRSSLTPTAVTNLLQSLKYGKPQLVSWSYYGDGLSSDANVYQVAQNTGGLLIDRGISGWQQILANLFASTVGLGTFSLGAQPDPTTLVLQIDGVTLPQQSAQGTYNWNYDAADNAVVLSSSVLPVPGSSVSISYSLSCQHP